jgi:predicted cobalt transporter CbtA
MLNRIDFARPRTVIVGALLAGVVAGLFAATFHRIVSEPLVDQAIGIEDANSAKDVHHAAEPEQVTRSDQRGAGLFIGYSLIGAAYGMFVALTALALRGGAWLDPFRRIAVAATILAGAITVVPWFKYPPNPPAVGDPDTAGERQRLWWILVIGTAVVLSGAAYLSGKLREAEWPEHRRIVAVVAGTAVALALLVALLPPNPDSISSDVPAALIWRFRVASLGGNMLLWSTLALGFGALSAEARQQNAAAVDAAPAVDVPASAGPTNGVVKL